MAALTELRSSLLSQLSQVDESLPGDWRFYHGRLVRERLTVPRVSWGSTATPRPGSCTPAWLTAAEFCEEESSLAVKVSLLQQLLLSSRQTVLYVGAGAATSAGLRQWARGDHKADHKADHKVDHRGDHRTTEAAPSVTHLTLASLVQVSHLITAPPPYLNSNPAPGWAG